MERMKEHPRVYDHILEAHLKENRQMAFVSGPRQVGKTTTCRHEGSEYLSWDILEDQRNIVRGPTSVANLMELDRARATPPVLVFDELHKYPKWKAFLKGFFDGYGDKAKVIVTGSSRLDMFKKGGDSLMGRYFLYRMHPFSVGEIARTAPPATPIHKPSPISDEDWNALWVHGGFPEPYLRRSDTFTRRWRSLRMHQLTKEDLREMTQLQDLGTMEVLAQILAERSGQQLTYAGLAKDTNIAGDTAKRWVGVLEQMHFGFRVAPWFKSVANSLRKEPKWFLRDWSVVSDEGPRAETFVGCQLLKAVEGWTDLGLGSFHLRYLRTKLKKEIDFLVVKDGKPWFLVEVKLSESSLSPSLREFQDMVGAQHAFQVVVNLPYEEVDSFGFRNPVVVPARTFLSQLM
jgi:predicted AAA+ superfamily ATPase